MITYDYVCKLCDTRMALLVSTVSRDDQRCPSCAFLLERQLSAPMGKMAGVTAKGGGPDKFTADMMGIPLKELPPALKTKL